MIPRNSLLLFAAVWLTVFGLRPIARAQASATVYLSVEAGVFSSNGARFWPTLAGTHYTNVVIAAGLPAAGVDYYSYASPAGVIPWSNGTLGNAQFVVYHPANNTYWVAQAFSTSGTNVGGGGIGVAASGFGMLGTGTPTSFCGGGGRATPFYTEIAIVSQILPPMTILSASATSISLGQPVTLTATTTSSSSTLFAQAIDNSSNGSTWTSGSMVSGANWSGGPTGQHSLVWTYTPPRSARGISERREPTAWGFPILRRWR